MLRTYCVVTSDVGQGFIGAGQSSTSRNGTARMTMLNRLDARRTQMLSELKNEMASLVESGDMTENEANEWVNRAADRWAQEG